MEWPVEMNFTGVQVFWGQCVKGLDSAEGSSHFSLSSWICADNEL